MKYEVLLIFFISLLILAVSFFYLFKHRKKENYQKMFLYILFLMLISLLFLILSALWFFELANYFYKDFIIIFSLLILIKSILLYGMFNSILKTKKIFFLFFLYFVLLIFPFITVQFYLLAIAISFLLMLLLFVNFYSNPLLRHSGKIGIFYSSLSLIFNFILFIFPLQILVFFFFSELFFLFFLISFFKTMQHEKNIFSRMRFKKKFPYFLEFLRYFILIVILVSVLFITTVSIHELGHITMSKLAGCNYQRIVYEQGTPYTEILCKELEGNLGVILGGLIGPLFIALLLFFGGGKFIREIAAIIVGFNLILSYKDFLELGLSSNLAVFFSIIGCLIVVIAIGFFSKSRIEDI
jgi:hypothetical protein